MNTMHLMQQAEKKINQKRHAGVTHPQENGTRMAWCRKADCLLLDEGDI